MPQNVRVEKKGFCAVEMKRVLTGIKPTGSPHLGNFVGMFRPALALAESPETEALYFIADSHALTILPPSEQLRQMTYEVAATWVAMGLDPSRVIFYRQSRIPEVFELFWILSCLTPKGLMNRAHAYKALMAEHQRQGKDEDQDAAILMGLYNYPILMAADILLFQTQVVPVGRDQLQHIEIARDLAGKFNQTYGDVLVVPEADIQDLGTPLTGLDGRKMSKSYGNTIPLFAPAPTLRSLVFKIKTNSLTPEEPKDPETCTLFSIYKNFALPEDVAYVRKRYATGIGWGEMKEIVYAVLEKTVAPKRTTYEELMTHTHLLDNMLEEGEGKARSIAQKTLSSVRSKIGVY